MTDPKMDDLDKMLDLAARRAPPVGDDLMSRVLADAYDLQPASQMVPKVRRSAWSSFRDLIGGWPAIGGLATAGVAGVWIGFAPPVSLENLAADLVGTTQEVDLMGYSYGLEDVFDG
ncbi:hypothetical protein [Yoonia sp. 208BN28-4]|uniref:hypothetical protein n=1 Tax=Yoonia sp. 208BN28-4 TaxID=3126505 RepID=UPI00309FA030